MPNSNADFSDLPPLPDFLQFPVVLTFEGVSEPLEGVTLEGVARSYADQGYDVWLGTEDDGTEEEYLRVQGRGEHARFIFHQAGEGRLRHVEVYRYERHINGTWHPLIEGALPVVRLLLQCI